MTAVDEIRKTLNFLAEATDDWLPNDPYEAEKLLCGEYIAKGYARHVYHHKTDPNLVVKIEWSATPHEVDGSFQDDGEVYAEQNQVEYEAWEWHLADHAVLSHWFAPCISRSENYLTITQQKVIDEIKDADVHGIILPLMFTTEFREEGSDPDLCRLANWGMHNGKPIIQDYGSIGINLDILNDPQALIPVRAVVDNGWIDYEELTPEEAAEVSW